MLVVFNDRDGDDEVLKGGAGIWLLYYRRPVMTRTLGAVLWGRAACVNIPVFLHFDIFVFLYFRISELLYFCISDMDLGAVLCGRAVCVNNPVFLYFAIFVFLYF